MRRWLLIILTVLAVVIVGAGFVIWRAVRPPAVSAFYNAPSVDGKRPGELLREESIDARGLNVRLWRILYTSSDATGKVIAVSGLVAAPTSPAPSGGYPLVAVGHGTAGINQGCAPSIDPFGKVDEQNTSYSYLVGQYVDAGYATVMADFEGLGVKGGSSYLLGEPEGRNVLDSARAIRSLSAVPVTSKVLIAGQSQGGHAALWAGQLAASYAPDVDVIGVVAQAPATNLEAMFTGVRDAGVRGGLVALLVMSADSYTRQYPELPANQVLTERGQGSVKNVVKKLCLMPAILGTQFATPADLFPPNALDALRPYVRKNAPGAAFTVPVFLAQGDTDGVVLPTVTAAYAADLCASKVQLTFKTYPATGHFDVVGKSTADALGWMTAVRNGQPPATTCN